MNYIRQILAFYDLVQVKQLSTGQIALWHALMAINNKCAWKEWFTAPNILLEINSGLSRQGIAKARNGLKQAGLIDFKSNGTKATSYHITTLNSVQAGWQCSCQDSLQDSVQDSVQDSSQAGSTLNKPKPKQKEYSAFFENAWLLYPNKKGKGQVSDTQKKKLEKIGLDVITKCIDRYKADKPDWQDYQNGSTFFNSGYVDYLDENYSKPEVGGSKWKDL